MIHPEVRKWFKMIKFRTGYGVRISDVTRQPDYWRCTLEPPHGYRIGNGRMRSYGMAFHPDYKSKIRIWK